MNSAEPGATPTAVGCAPIAPIARAAAEPLFEAAREMGEVREAPVEGDGADRAVGHRRWIFGPAGDIAVDIAGAMVANSGDALVAAAVAGMGIVYQPGITPCIDHTGPACSAGGNSNPVQLLTSPMK